MSIKIEYFISLGDDKPLNMCDTSQWPQDESIEMITG